MFRSNRALSLCTALVLVGCGGAGQGDPDAEVVVDVVDPDAVVTDFVAGGDRPATVHVPDAYDPREPMPLLLFLHGYGYTGDFYEEALNLTAQADARGFLYAHPTGTVDQDGEPFWSASSACCNFYGSDVDDSAYLLGLIDEVKATVNVDASRVLIMGHSNGAFMAHRLACDHADVISGIVTISGVVSSSCAPSEPVSLLHVHGTADTTVAFGGGSLAAPYLSATDSTELWAALNGCNVTPREVPGLIDADRTISGAETTVTIYDERCNAGGYAELWTVAGGPHAIQPTAAFMDGAIDFMIDHPKP